MTNDKPADIELMTRLAAGATLLLRFFLIKWNRDSQVLHIYLFNEDKVLKLADNLRPKGKKPG